MNVLVLRPDPGAAATVARLREAGHETLASPLFEAVPIAWQLPPELPGAVMLTSAQAARLGGGGLAALVKLPCYAVGDATADAARAAGFVDVRAGDGDAATLLDHAMRDGFTSLLHLAGGDHRAVANPAAQVKWRIVYAMQATHGLRASAQRALEQGGVDWTLLHSPRAAERFAMLVDRAGLDRGDIALAALSPAVADAAGGGWRDVAVAARPTDAALLAAAGLLCDKASE